MFGSKKKKRFEIIYEQGVANVSRILVDRETGVHYLQISINSGGGITPLLDNKGKVVVDRSAVSWDEE